jgi:hypothetical protein
VRAALADGDAEEEMATEKRYEYLMSTTNNNSYTRARILLHRRTVTRLAHGSSGERTQSYKWDTTLTHKRARATLACWFAMRPILPPTLLFLALFVVTHARATYARDGHSVTFLERRWARAEWAPHQPAPAADDARWDTDEGQHAHARLLQRGRVRWHATAQV